MLALIFKVALVSAWYKKMLIFTNMLETKSKLFGSVSGHVYCQIEKFSGHQRDLITWGGVEGGGVIKSAKMVLQIFFSANLISNILINVEIRKTPQYNHFTKEFIISKIHNVKKVYLFDNYLLIWLKIEKSPK